MEHDWCVSQGGKGAVVTGKGENDRFQVFRGLRTVLGEKGDKEW